MSGRDMDAWIAFAKDLSKEQLVEFIKKKGNERKHNLCEITRYQTEDYVRACDQHRHNTEALTIRSSQLAEFQKRQLRVDQDIAEQTQLVSNLKTQMNQQGSDKEGKAGMADQCLTKLNNTLIDFSKEKNTKLFQYLEIENNESLVKGIETLVAILRGHRTANNVDVELYLSDFDKLMYKLKRADVENLNLPLIQMQKAKLAKQVSAFTDDSNPHFAVCGEFHCYIKWAMLFCEYAEVQIVANAFKEGSDLVAGELRNGDQKKQNLEALKVMWKDLGICDFYESSKNNLDNRLKDYETIVQMDEKQAQEFQTKYHGFEKIYFKSLQDIVKGVQASQ